MHLIFSSRRGTICTTYYYHHFILILRTIKFYPVWGLHFSIFTSSMTSRRCCDLFKFGYEFLLKAQSLCLPIGIHCSRRILLERIYVYSFAPYSGGIYIVLYRQSGCDSLVIDLYLMTIFPLPFSLLYFNLINILSQGAIYR